MSKASVALNRFGYGLKLGERAPSNPQADLLRQLREFDARPGPLSARPDTSGEAGELLQIIRRARRQRNEAASAMESNMAMQTGQGATQATKANGAATEKPQPSARAQLLAQLPPDYRAKVQEAYGRYRVDVAARFKVAVASPNPFAERLVHFWSNHFSVSAGKPGTPFEVGNHEFNAIRPHVTGKFTDMLKAAVLHPAMLLYLDQFQSIGPNSQFGARRRKRNPNQPERGLNENLAREVLELHTLGVDGGYSQSDVTEFARALTGWTIRGLSRLERFAKDQPGGAAFVDIAHERGSRTILGRQYADTGADQAIAILDDLAAHPSTARFVATKLARHFTKDEPEPSLIARLERDFRRTGGDLESLATTLVNAPESWTGEPAKFRQPVEWFTSILRFTGVDTLSEKRINGLVRQLGQVPWGAPSPAGFDDVAESWAGSDALLRRVELADRIARNAPSDAVLARAEAAFPGALSDNTRTWLSRAESGRQALGLMLVAPEMMRR
ncbi:MAG: DUF1800 domain-containing protein [Pseudomonadota bacterium]